MFFKIFVLEYVDGGLCSAESEFLKVNFRFIFVVSRVLQLVFDVFFAFACEVCCDLLLVS